MSEISTASCTGLIESGGGFISGVCGLTRHFHFVGRLSEFWGRMKNSLPCLSVGVLESRHEVAILYFGRTSEFLVKTSECMEIPDEGCTLDQMLHRLRQRGERWADELAGSHVVCFVDGKAAGLSDSISAGCLIEISSRKSIFEA